MPEGFLADTGELFDDRRNGFGFQYFTPDAAALARDRFRYGWNIDLSAAGDNSGAVSWAPQPENFQTDHKNPLYTAASAGGRFVKGSDGNDCADRRFPFNCIFWVDHATQTKHFVRSCITAPCGIDACSNNAEAEPELIRGLATGPDFDCHTPSRALRDSTHIVLDTKRLSRSTIAQQYHDDCYKLIGQGYGYGPGGAFINLCSVEGVDEVSLHPSFRAIAKSFPAREARGGGGHNSNRTANATVVVHRRRLIPHCSDECVGLNHGA